MWTGNASTKSGNQKTISVGIKKLGTLQGLVAFEPGMPSTIYVTICCGYVAFQVIPFHRTPVRLLDKWGCTVHNASLWCWVIVSSHPKCLVKDLRIQLLPLQKYGLLSYYFNLGLV